MKIITKNVKSLLSSDNQELLSILRKKYSAKIPGYRYSKAYKRGWDGSKYFISKKGEVGTGLIPFIVEDLESADVSYTLIDKRAVPVDSFDISVDKISYRNYQKNLIKLALEKRLALIEAPTGAGKTIILAGLLQALKNKSGVVFFSQKSILLQTYNFLIAHGFDVGIVYGGATDIKPVTLCTVQSVHKILDTHLNAAEFIVFDEVHEFANGKLTTSVVKSFPNASYRFGMSATMPKERMAKLNLVSYLGAIISEVDVMGLVEDGFLTPPIITFVKMPEYNDHSLLNASYNDIYDSQIINNDYRNNAIKDICSEVLEEDALILILVKNLKHLEILKNLIPSSVTLEGKDDEFLRESVIEEFKTSKKGVLIGTKIMQTGIDIPEITHLINARGLKSEIATIQALGRALRIHKSKKEVKIYDFHDEVPYLKEHAKARKRSYKSLKVQIND